jgi:hypothetical protein
VTIDEDFWLFDTPCTQAVWEAVMGAPPSAWAACDGARRSVQRDEKIGIS